MKRIVLIVIPLIVIVTLGATLLIITVYQPPSSQDELKRYLQYRNTSTPEEYEIQRIMVASKPWNFNVDMSKVTFGESAYYQTDFRYGEELPDQDTLDLIPGDAPSGSLMPLPFPPEKLWCVFVENIIGTKSGFDSRERTELVLVALHQDLYNADIIIHETVAETPIAMEEIIVEIGCEIP